MSRGYNRVVIMGNLTKDPDVRFTPNKQKVARMTVAVGNQWKDRNTGELRENVDFIPVVAWRFTADICERFLKKGRPVLVEGRISVRDFDDARTGQHRWVTEVVADNVVLLGSGNRREDDSSSSSRGYSNVGSNSSDAVDSSDLGSLRDEAGFEDEFPLDFSEVNGEDESGDVEIPF